VRPERRNPGPRSSGAKGSRGRPSLEVLSPRERDVVAGLVRGLTNKKMGVVLGISHRTIEIHRARLMRKLDVTNLSGLLEIAFAQRDKLPSLERFSQNQAGVTEPPS
jgi:FixJ family two-component response regulator